MTAFQKASKTPSSTKAQKLCEIKAKKGEKKDSNSKLRKNKAKKFCTPQSFDGQEQTLNGPKAYAALSGSNAAAILNAHMYECVREPFWTLMAERYEWGFKIGVQWEEDICKWGKTFCKN